MTIITTSTTCTRSRARNAVLAAVLCAALAAPPLGVASARASSRAALAQAPAPCSLVQPCRLSTGLPPSYARQQPILTPDGDTVVFEHTADAGNTRELYSIPVRGGADPVRLDPPQAPPSRQITITPDGERVLYLSDRAQGRALFSVPINGPASAAVRLSPAVLGSFQVSPDSRKVAFQSTTRRIRAVPVVGPESRGVALTDPDTGSFGVSSNSRHLVFTDSTGADSELFRVPLTLNPDPDQRPTQLSGRMVEGGGVHSFRLPVGTGPMVYSADQDIEGIRELYSVGFGGGNRTKLNVPLPPGWSVGLKNDHADGFQSGYGISRDGRRVVYVIQTNFDITVNGLFSVPVTGPADASRRLDITAPNTLPPVFHITSDSRRVVYAAEEGNGGPGRSFSVPIDGPADARVKVSASGEDGAFVQVGPNGQRVVSTMPILNQDARLSSPVDEPFPSPNMVRVNGPERVKGSVVFDPQSRRVAYVAEAVAGEFDVFSSALESHSRFNLTATLTADFIASPAVSDQHAVYAAHVSDDGFPALLLTPDPGNLGVTTSCTGARQMTRRVPGAVVGAHVGGLATVLGCRVAGGARRGRVSSADHQVRSSDVGPRQGPRALRPGRGTDLSHHCSCGCAAPATASVTTTASAQFVLTNLGTECWTEWTGVGTGPGADTPSGVSTTEPPTGRDGRRSSTTSA